MVTSKPRALACDVVAYFDFPIPHTSHILYFSPSDWSQLLCGRWGEVSHCQLPQVLSPPACTRRTLISYLPLPIPCLYESLCWGRHQSCRNRTDLSSHPISMKCCFLLNWEQCWLYASHTLQSADEYIRPSVLSWQSCRVCVGQQGGELAGRCRSHNVFSTRFALSGSYVLHIEVYVGFIAVL